MPTGTTVGLAVPQAHRDPDLFQAKGPRPRQEHQLIRRAPPALAKRLLQASHQTGGDLGPLQDDPIRRRRQRACAREEVSVQRRAGTAPPLRGRAAARASLGQIEHDALVATQAAAEARTRRRQPRR